MQYRLDWQRRKQIQGKEKPNAARWLGDEEQDPVLSYRAQCTRCSVLAERGLEAVQFTQHCETPPLQELLCPLCQRLEEFTRLVQDTVFTPHQRSEFCQQLNDIYAIAKDQHREMRRREYGPPPVDENGLKNEDQSGAGASASTSSKKRTRAAPVVVEETAGGGGGK